MREKNIKYIILLYTSLRRLLKRFICADFNYNNIYLYVRIVPRAENVIKLELRNAFVFYLRRSDVRSFEQIIKSRAKKINTYAFRNHAVQLFKYRSVSVWIS